ncbi:MAG: hypothetical protein MJA27_08635 [Pseudanabaenales cyanobacterium]|nr:hypothetical protein [Pseudanabaenales cyanobacterium]
MFWNVSTTWGTLRGSSLLFGAAGSRSLEWLYLSIVDNAFFAHLFTLGHLTIASLLIWRIVMRQFRMSQATLLSKRLSYISVAYLNVLAWGFLQTSALPAEDRLAGIPYLYGLNAAVFMVLIFRLVPSRQMLLDWVRYRRGHWFEWVWDDGSPSVGAIAINCLITAALIAPWMLLASRGRDSVPLGLMMATLSVGASFLIYATLVQIIFSTRLRAPLTWSVGVVATLIIVPLIVLARLGLFPEVSSRMMTIWTFLGYPFWDYSKPGSFSSAWIGLVMQWVLLVLLLSRLRRNLNRLSL